MDALVALLLRVYTFLSYFFSIPVFLVFILWYLLFLFYTTYSTFFKIIFSILFLLVSAMLLACFNGDFFSGFLITAEMPIFLLAILFFFHKYTLSFDSVYAFAPFSKRFGVLTVSSLFLAFLFITLRTKVLTPFVYTSFIPEAFSFHDRELILLDSRNDFLVWYIFYYIVNNFLVLYIAVLIFVVSFVCILIYYFSRLYSITKADANSSVLFMRKQQLLRQAAFNNSLRFFKNKIK